MLPRLLLTAFLLATLALPVAAQDAAIFPRGTKAPNVHHTGDVWLHSVSEADDTFDFSVTVATFAPSARLNWHVHPAGQQLLILDGTGYYQERGEPVRVVREGDAVRCPPGVEHWHAAAPDAGVTYLATTGDAPTRWLEPVTDAEYAAGAGGVERELLALSRQKWLWMADRDVDALAALFHPDARFVHMGGTWGTARELDIIETGSIWYKQADVHEAVVERVGDTAVVWNRITLVAEVGGTEVTNPFTVTEVYRREGGAWALLALTFSSVRDGHTIEP